MGLNKVFFLLPNLCAGGAERVSITMARILNKEGLEVEFINFGDNNGELFNWIVPEFRLTSLGFSRTLQAIPKLHGFMKENGDAIFFSSREHVNLISLIAAKGTGAQCVVRIPNMPRNILTKGFDGFKMNVIKRINLWALRSAKVIIAQNVEMKNQLIDFYNLPQEKIKAINNPIDKDYIVQSAECSWNPFNEKEVNFLNVCNIAYSKGIDILEAAWPKVKKVIPNAHMYIVGRSTSELAKELIKEASQLQDFTFIGFKSNPYPYLKYCDVFVLSSRMEGFPNVVLEAMCFNKPIASTICVDVIKDIIHNGENGYYCGINNPDTLAECMIKASCLHDISNSYSLFEKESLVSCFS